MRATLNGFCLVFLVGFSCLSLANEPVAAPLLQITWTEQALERDYLSLRDTAVQSAFNTLAAYVSKTLVLESDLHFVISEGLEKYYAPESHEIYVPVSSLYHIVEGSQARYPEQGEVQEGIISASLKHLFFSDFISAKVQALSIPVVGWDRERIDSFALLSQLHAFGHDHMFVLDAAEEYLQVDRWRPALNDNQFLNEFAADEYRYRRMVCLVQGFEAQYGAVAREDDTACMKRYLNEVAFWQGALEEYLRPASPINDWARTVN